MNSTIPSCRTLTVFAFRGDRTRAFAWAFLSALDEEKNSRGIGPTAVECLLFTGHAGVSIDRGTTIYGFNPDGLGLPVWQLMDRLRNGDALPGLVRDDTTAFREARNRGLMVHSFDVVLPQPRFQDFDGKLDGERKKSQYSYGFPNGDGDCNCITWLERLGLPLLTGRMDEFFGLPGVVSGVSRRFGECV